MILVETRFQSKTKYLKFNEVNMTEHIIEKKINFENEMSLLNQLPYAITVHDNNDKIVFENARASELFGLRVDDLCISRWCHHSDYVRNSCPLCPGKFTKKDGTQHKVFRKLIDPNLNVRYLEFESVPVLNGNKEPDGFIEIVRDVTEGETIKLQNLSEDLGERKEERIFTLVKHGLTGSQILFTDKIYFTDNLDSFLMRLAGFAFIGIVQNDLERTGLFGPIPVLDQKTHEMFAFPFSVTDDSIQDPRKHHHELLLLLIMFERNDPIHAINRNLVHDLIASYVFNLKTIDDITNEWFDLVKTELNKLIDS